LWQDDLESFGLINPEDDPVSYNMLRELDNAVMAYPQRGVEEITGLLYALIVLDGSWVSEPGEHPPTAAQVRRVIKKHFNLN